MNEKVRGLLENNRGSMDALLTFNPVVSPRQDSSFIEASNFQQNVEIREARHIYSPASPMM